MEFVQLKLLLIGLESIKLWKWGCVIGKDATFCASKWGDVLKRDMFYSFIYMCYMWFLLSTSINGFG